MFKLDMNAVRKGESWKVVNLPNLPNTTKPENAVKKDEAACWRVANVASLASNFEPKIQKPDSTRQFAKLATRHATETTPLSAPDKQADPNFFNEFNKFTTNPEAQNPDSTRQFAKLATRHATETAFLSMLDRQLLAVAMLLCDQENDSPANRAAMRRECLETPEHQRADLLAYLRSRVTDKGALQRALTPPPPAPPPKPKAQPTSDEWRVLSRAYYDHHFGCPICIAAGKGTQYGLRCGTGTALWAAYEDSTVDAPKFTKVHKEFTKSTTSPQKSTPQDGDKSAIVTKKSPTKDTPK